MIKMFFLRYAIFVFLLLWGSKLSAQLLTKADLDTCKVYTSINEASKNPLAVYILDLTRSKLDVFPEAILEFKNLHVLKLGKNKLTSLPESIEELTYLVELNLDKNLLDSFPIAITKLVNLKKLVLSQNTITAIPFAINNLTQLEYLDMWSNELSYFPDSFKEMTTIKYVDLRVIQFSRTERAYILSLFPNAKVMLSESCNCGL